MVALYYIALILAVLFLLFSNEKPMAEKISLTEAREIVKNFQ